MGAQPCSDNTGIPRNMTSFAEHLQRAGYKTHFVGKWDAGMATPKHSPHGRGYDTSLHYFSHANDYWDQTAVQSTMDICCGKNYRHSRIVDFWRTDRGAADMNGTSYSEFLYQREILNIVEKHDTSVPLLLFYAPHVAHAPLQVPKEYYDQFGFMEDNQDQCKFGAIKAGRTIDPRYPDLPWKCRQQYHATVMVMDDVVGNVTNALKRKGMWENTLVIYSADNGGSMNPYESAANNWPLLGGKYSFFEGGIRVAAFISGGVVPLHLRGTVNDGIIHIADWYATLCGLAGVDPTDTLASASGLPPIDSLNMWPFLSGEAASPRTTIPVSRECLIQGDWKLIVGTPASNDYEVRSDYWQGSRFLSNTSKHRPQHDCKKGCLFNVAEDRTEQRNVYVENPMRVAQMLAKLEHLKKSYFENDDFFKNDCPAGTERRHCACWMADNKHGGFLGPFAMTRSDRVSVSPAVQLHAFLSYRSLS